MDAEDPDPPMEPSGSFLLPQSMEGPNLHTVTVDPETHARLEALLEAAGIFFLKLPKFNMNGIGCIV